MSTIVTGRAASFTVQVMQNGAPVAIATTDQVTLQLFSEDGTEPLSNENAVSATDAGSNWAKGIIAVSVEDTVTENLPLPAVMLAVTWPGGVKRFRIIVVRAYETERSALFVKDFIVDELRADRLMLAGQSYFGGATLSDEFLWNKVLAAEAEMRHRIRAPLVPTYFFPSTPTDQELNDIEGAPWDIDPGYDYSPDLFGGDRWCHLCLVNKPLISLDKVQLTYPNNNLLLDMPIDWFIVDKKYAEVRMVPTSAGHLSAFIGSSGPVLALGRLLPQALKMWYVAGIADAKTQYPEMVDCIKKMAVLSCISDGFLPQSGSISGDGLSESMSVDVSKYSEIIDTIIDGPKGSNGGLVAAIHGIRLGVV